MLPSLSAPDLHHHEIADRIADLGASGTVVESVIPVYPMPAPEHDPRFTFGLTADVGKVLAAHGYPPIRTGTDHVRLQQALFGFLYTLTPAAPAAAGVSPQPVAPADPGTPGAVTGADTSPHPFVDCGRSA